MKCPKCDIEMKVFKENGIETDICPKCKGVWVDKFEEKQVLKIIPEVFTVSELRDLHKVYKPLGRTEKVKYCKCPRCSRLMWRKNYMHHSGIVVDKCKKHGTFFDEGELQKAVEFIKAGGIEYEKLKITERGITETRDKLLRDINRVERADLLGRRARWLMFLGF